jgi:hypothetical protein
MNNNSNVGNIDTNVANYTISELMAISGITDIDKDEITSKTNTFITKYKTSNPQISTFFKAIQSQLLQYSADLNNTDDDPEEAQYPSGQAQTSKWISNEALPQKDANQQNKSTDRKDKVEVYGNQHVPMNREQLGINNTFDVPVAQDSLNPTLKNTITRFVNLDSQFRQYSSNFENSSTDYTLDLSDRLSNVLSIRVYSYQIPYSWYTIDVAYGNTCFWITDGSCNVPISINSGNYNASEFTTALNKSFKDAGFHFPTTPPDTPVTYNSNNGKLSFSLYDGSFNGLCYNTFNGDGIPGSFIITQSTIMTFFDPTAILQCQTNCVNQSYYVNQTLGWLMGFRTTTVFVDPSGNNPTGNLDLNGTKYLILVIDDYNQNHVNNGLVSITETTNSNIKLPSYYSPDLPYVCSNTNIVSSSSDLLIAGKSNFSFNSTPVLVPSAPRTLTQSQIYTINEINKNKNNNTNYKSKAPTSPDILSVLPIKNSGISTGSMLIEFSGSLQESKRTYFGPVNIDKMRVKLLDDKGNVINLNGCDWCVTLICECLYQY